MATYDTYKEFAQNLPSVRPGCFWLHVKVNLAQINSKNPNNAVLATGDNLRVCRIKDKWLLLRGFTRVNTGCSNALTVNVGTAASGTELDAVFDGQTAGDWIIMDTLKSAGEIAVTADGYIYCHMDGGVAPADGEFELMIEVYVGPEDAQMDSYA